MSKELTLFASRFLNSSVLLGDSQVVRGIEERSAGAGNPVSDVRTLDVELEGMWRKETFYAALHHRLNIVVLLVIQRPGRSIVGGLRLYDGNSWKQKKCKISIWLRSVVIIGTSTYMVGRSMILKEFLTVSEGDSVLSSNHFVNEGKELVLDTGDGVLPEAVCVYGVHQVISWLDGIPRHPSAFRSINRRCRNGGRYAQKACGQ